MTTLTQQLARTDWHERRHDLRAGMVFKTREGSIVELDRTVPGDGTKWYVLDYHQGGWFREDSTIEPGDLEIHLNADGRRDYTGETA